MQQCTYNPSQRPPKIPLSNPTPTMVNEHSSHQHLPYPLIGESPPPSSHPYLNQTTPVMVDLIPFLPLFALTYTLTPFPFPFPTMDSSSMCPKGSAHTLVNPPAPLPILHQYPPIASSPISRKLKPRKSSKRIDREFSFLANECHTLVQPSTTINFHHNPSSLTLHL